MDNEITISINHLLSFLRQQAKETGHFMYLYKNEDNEWKIEKKPTRILHANKPFYLINGETETIIDAKGNEIVLK